MYSLVLVVGGEPSGGTLYETMDASFLGDALKFPFKRWLGFVNWKGGVGGSFIYLFLCVRSELVIRCFPLWLSDLTVLRQCLSVDIKPSVLTSCPGSSQLSAPQHQNYRHTWPHFFSSS